MTGLLLAMMLSGTPRPNVRCDNPRIAICVRMIVAMAWNWSIKDMDGVCWVPKKQVRELWFGDPAIEWKRVNRLTRIPNMPPPEEDCATDDIS